MKRKLLWKWFTPLVILITMSFSPISVCDEYNAHVDSVYDGDTVTCDIEVGFGIHIIERIRLSRINAPEVRGAEKPQGYISRDALKELIEGKDIILINLGRGKYGRVIGELEIDGVNVSDWLVENGYAVYRTY